MAERPRRTASERELARRTRANDRARRAGRTLPYEDPAAGLEPPAAPSTDFVEPDAPAPGEPDPVAEPPLIAPRTQPVQAPEPEALHEPDAEPVHEPEAVPDPGPAPELVDEPEPIEEPEPAPERPIKSFPSPPDPEFYVPDDQLETPSGTRRVSRGSRPHAGHRPARPHRRSRAPRRPRAQRSHRWPRRIIALLALLLAAAVVWFAIELFQPFGTSPHGRVTVTIPPHTASSEVGRLLQHDGVIASRFFFIARATLDGDRGDIRAGTYHLRRGMSYGAVLTALTKAPPAVKTSELTIAEGHTRQYVAGLLRHQHIRGNYLAATRHSRLLDLRRYGAPKSVDSLEGFLFPDTFRLVDPIKVKALVADQLIDFKRRFATIHLAVAHRHHLSAFDVVTIASLIEAESASARDDRLVSSVIYNRLRDHMMLQLDSTARYATGNFTKALTVTQLASKSPYNTHTHYGLPPGPIDSPGLTALRAAADPASSQYLYFFSKPCSHQSVFATSYGQFENLLIRDRRTHCP